MDSNFQFKNDAIYTLLKARIESGFYPVGKKLPPEPEFARELNVGKVTLRAALANLEHEKLIVRMRSKGTFVAECKPQTINKIAVVSSSSASEIGSPGPYLLSLVLKEAERCGVAVEQIEYFLVENLPIKLLKKRFREHRIDGIILITSNFTGHEPMITQCRELRLPVVLPQALLGDAAKTGFGTVLVDERQAFQTTLDYCLQGPFQRIAMLGRLDELAVPIARGFSEEELRTILGKRLHLINFLDYDSSKIRAWVEQLYATPGPKPDLFICYSDLYAIFLILALKAQGIRVPDDVSVVGFSGLGSEFEIMTELAGVKYRYAQMVAAAMQLLRRHEEWFNPEQPGAAPELVMDYDFDVGTSMKPIVPNVQEA